MGQEFYASAYDMEKRTCYEYYCDKFHSDCYSFSGSVVLMHYLLRKAPYRIIYGGDKILNKDIFSRFSTEDELIALSSYLNLKDCYLYERYPELIDDENFKRNEKFISDNYEKWNRMNMEKILEEAEKYFNIHYTHSVNYSGYLINHTKKIAIDLHDYYEKSVSSNEKNQKFVIDPIPVLTETGGGIEMALFDGLSPETTDELTSTWLGDLLQIVDILPNDYKLINCCFVDATYRAHYCYHKYGVNKKKLLYKNDKKELFEVVFFNYWRKRNKPSKIKVTINKNELIFDGVL